MTKYRWLYCVYCALNIHDDGIEKYQDPQEVGEHVWAIFPEVPQERLGTIIQSERKREWEKNSTIDLSRLFPWSAAREEMEEVKEMMSHWGEYKQTKRDKLSNQMDLEQWWCGGYSWGGETFLHVI